MCTYSSNDEIKCVNGCKTGYFEYSSQCFKCSYEIDNCGECHYDTNNTKLICDSCTNGFEKDEEGLCSIPCKENEAVGNGWKVCSKD